MKKSIGTIFLVLILQSIFMIGCVPAIIPTPVPSTSTLSPISPTFAPQPTATEIPIPLKPSKSDTVSPEQQIFLDSKQGQVLQEWLTKWVEYWSTAQESQRVFSPETRGSETARAYFRIMEDPKSPISKTLVLESPDYPDVVILPPFWAVKEHLNPPTAELNHKVSVENEPLFLNTTSGDELAKLGMPTDANLVFTNDEFMMIDKSGAVVGVVNLKIGSWESAENYKLPIARTKSEINNCRITKADINSGKFRIFAKIVDNSIFPSNVRVDPIGTMGFPPPDFDFLGWEGDESGNVAIREFYKNNPDKLPYRVIVFCTINYQELDTASPSVDVAIKQVKFIDQSGRISFLTLVSTLNSTEDPHNPDILQIVFRGGDVNAAKIGYREPELRVKLLKEWTDTEIIPFELEELWLWELR